MISEKLPPPIVLNSLDCGRSEDIIEYVYQNYFKYEFMDKQKRERLFGKFIYLDLDFIDYRPERFWHIISFKPSEEKYTVNPCVNANDSLLCDKLKTNCYDKMCIPGDYRLKNRCECVYRLRRIHWVNPILKLANNKDSDVKVWFEDARDAKNKKNRKIYVRFQDKLADYLIILIDGTLNRKNGYKFVTAYPVVHNGTKRRLDRSFKNYEKY